MATSQPPQWTPQLVEDLIARQFLHNQDVTSMRPPAPLAPRNANIQQQQQGGGVGGIKGGGSAIVPFTDATKQYMKFFNQTMGINNAAAAATHSSAATTPAVMSPASKTVQPNAAIPHGASPRYGGPSVAPSQQFPPTTAPSSSTNSNPPSPQSRGQQPGGSMFPAGTVNNNIIGGSNVVPPSPSSHRQLQQLQQIQQQLAASNNNNNNNNGGTMMNTSPSTVNNSNNNNNANNAAAAQQQQQQQGVTNATATDCVAQCKLLATTKVQFPPHIPTNSALMARPDPAKPTKSLCPPPQLMMQRIMAQEKIDADLIFAQPMEDFPLAKIFGAYPEALQVIANARGESGDWRSDTFTKTEEAAYKRDMRFEAVGPYQARSNNFGF